MMWIVCFLQFAAVVLQWNFYCELKKDKAEAVKADAEQGKADASDSSWLVINEQGDVVRSTLAEQDGTDAGKVKGVGERLGEAKAADAKADRPPTYYQGDFAGFDGADKDAKEKDPFTLADGSELDSPVLASNAIQAKASIMSRLSRG